MEMCSIGNWHLGYYQQSSRCGWVLRYVSATFSVKVRGHQAETPESAVAACSNSSGHVMQPRSLSKSAIMLVSKGRHDMVQNGSACPYRS